MAPARRRSIGRPKKGKTTHNIITKDIAQVILNVRSFFEKEKERQRLSIGLGNVVHRTVAATKKLLLIRCVL